MGTEPEQVEVRPKGGTGNPSLQLPRRWSVPAGGPRRPRRGGGLAAGAALSGPVSVLPHPPGGGVGISGRWGTDRWLTPVTLGPRSPPPRLSSEWKGDWVEGGSFPVSWEICQVESSLPTFVTISPLLSLFSLFPPLPLFHLHSPLFSRCLSLLQIAVCSSMR